MDALAAIATCLSTTEEMLATATRLAHDVSPPENQTTGADQPSQGAAIHPRDIHSSPDYGALLDQEEQVRAKLMERHRGAPTSYFPNTDEESGQEGPPSQQVEGRRKVSVGSSEKPTIW